MHYTGQEKSQQLVLTAIGKDKTGLVSELTGLVSECNCNILDSKMAIFGNEFTMIMLLSGGIADLLQLEIKLPTLALELDLLTMMKRTSAHKEFVKEKVLLSLEGEDKPGTIKSVTSYLAENDIAIASLKSNTSIENELPWQRASIMVELPDNLALEQFKQECQQLCETLNMTCSIKSVALN